MLGVRLGRLSSARSARIALARIAQAQASGDITPQAANALTGTVRAFLGALKSEAVEDQLHQLRGELRQLQERGS